MKKKENIHSYNLEERMQYEYFLKDVAFMVFDMNITFEKNHP